MKPIFNKRQQQKELTSKAIVDASIEEFAKNGYLNATFSHIANNAKVTKGLIVQRFGSKEQLFNHLFHNILIKDFPNLNDFIEIDEALVRIIQFIKQIGERSKYEVAFALTSLVNFVLLPNECVKDIKNVFLIQNQQCQQVLVCLKNQAIFQVLLLLGLQNLVQDF